ncbi:MAG TPA: inositol monophosphatase family protein [Propionibacteriaceae bacterium]|nr:inositol monophosphatase family protein [Propionibacteriaceae bacterium]
MDDLKLAAELVRDAGLLASRMLAEGLDTEYKTSVSDVVSTADRVAEELVVSRLRRERPADGLIGEEGSSEPGERTWFVDPVDGTYNFLSGLPYWCSAVGLADRHGPVLGAVYFPVVDELWLGGRDQPTTRNGVPVPQLVDRPLSQVSMTTYLHPARMKEDQRRKAWESAISGAATLRVMGSASIDLSYVAAGRHGVFLQSNLNEWDWLPGAALVLAAGGATEIVSDGDIRWQIAGNAQTVAEVKARLQG